MFVCIRYYINVIIYICIYTNIMLYYNKQVCMQRITISRKEINFHINEKRNSVHILLIQILILV